MSNNKLQRHVMCVFILIISSTLYADDLNLNPPFGDSTYAAYRVFSPDHSDAADYKDQVIVVFHGFLSAVPNGTFKRIRKKFLQTHTTIGINYDPLEVDNTVKFLDEIAKHYLQGHKVTVIGTSLGGFWADYFGNAIDAEKIIKLNPMVNPSTQLSKHVDKTQHNKRRGQDYAMTRNTLEMYEKLEKKKQSGVASLLILTKDDEHIPYDLAIDKYHDQVGVTIQVYDNGGHTINLKKHEALQRIADYIHER